MTDGILCREDCRLIVGTAFGEAGGMGEELSVDEDPPRPTADLGTRAGGAEMEGATTGDESLEDEADAGVVNVALGFTNLRGAGAGSWTGLSLVSPASLLALATVLFFRTPDSDLAGLLVEPSSSICPIERL